MIDIIFVIGLTRDDYLPAGISIVRRNVTELVRRFAERASRITALSRVRSTPMSNSSSFSS